MAEILIVDDEPHLREVVRYALEREGHTVREASDGRVALAELARSEPDLMVLDVLMPELDGIEVCRRVRQSSRLPIVFLSSRGEELDRVLGLELGGDDYVTKPFSPRELVSRVKAVLRRTQPAAPIGDQVVRHGPIAIVPEEHRVTVGDVRPWSSPSPSSACCSRSCAAPARSTRARIWSKRPTTGRTSSPTAPWTATCATSARSCARPAWTPSTPCTA